MCDFNTTYSQAVDTFLNGAQVHDLGGVTYVKCDNLVYIHATKAPVYRIPCEIQELLTLGTIYKKHAFGLTLCMNTDIGWDSADISEINGRELLTGTYVCDGCEKDLAELSYWTTEPYAYYDLCDACHTKFTDIGEIGTITYLGTFINLTEIGSKMVRYTQVNLLDWVEFMCHDGYNTTKFYVNCNPGNSHYGNIMIYTSGEYEFSLNIIYNSAQALVSDINTWLRSVPSIHTQERLSYIYSDYPDVDVMEFIRKDLKMEIESTETMIKRELKMFNDERYEINYIDCARRHGIIETDQPLTTGMVLQYSDLFPGVLINNIHERLHYVGTYHHPYFSTFAKWCNILKVQCGRNIQHGDLP